MRILILLLTILSSQHATASYLHYKLSGTIDSYTDYGPLTQTSSSTDNYNFLIDFKIQTNDLLLIDGNRYNPTNHNASVSISYSNVSDQILTRYGSMNEYFDTFDLMNFTIESNDFVFDVANRYGEDIFFNASASIYNLQPNNINSPIYLTSENLAGDTLEMIGHIDSVHKVPEPSSLAMMLIGLTAIFRRKINLV